MKNKKSLFSRISQYRKTLEDQMRQKKNGTFLVYFVLRFFVLVAAVLTALQRNYESMFLCILTLILFLVPSFLEKKLQITFPSTLEKITLIFVFAAQILGEIQSYYTKIPWWDTMLHTLNGFLCAAIGFALVDILNRNSKVRLKLSPFFLAIVAFCFSMTVGVLWEFFEFGMDVFFQLDMQKDTIVYNIASVELDPTNSQIPVQINGIESVIINGQELGLGGYLDIGLYDTMKDMIVNFIGAVVFSIIGYFYVKNRGKKGFASEFIPIATADATDTETAQTEQPDSTETWD